MKSKILTESGTNELEIIEFNVGRGTYGINVAKVGEVLNFNPNITEFPNSNKAIEGTINLRGKVMPVVNLFTVLNIAEENFKKMMIYTTFNNREICFIVGDVTEIHKDSWENIESTANFLNTIDGEQYVSGILKKGEELVSIVDFESIISRLLGEQMDYEVGELEELIKSKKQILFAEDSPVISRVIKDNLIEIGFTNIKSFINGKTMWDYLNANKENVDDIFCVISDIEMPKMDGWTLCKKIKDDSTLKKLKVVLFSSLITDELRHKGESVGADAQINKPEMGELLNTLKSILD